jgi:hypothetical protein
LLLDLNREAGDLGGPSGITVGEIQSTAGEEDRFLEVLAVAQRHNLLQVCDRELGTPLCG